MVWLGIVVLSAGYFGFYGHAGFVDVNDNPMARAWTEKAAPDEPCGLLGPVRILAADPARP